MATITAQQILDESNWTVATISLVNLEYLIDNVINYVNMMAGTSISNLAGGAGAKTVTVTASQDVVVKSGVNLMLRAYTERGPNTSMAGVNVAAVVSDPHYKVMSMVFKNGINKLCGVSFEAT